MSDKISPTPDFQSCTRLREPDGSCGREIWSLESLERRDRPSYKNGENPCFELTKDDIGFVRIGAGTLLYADNRGNETGSHTLPGSRTKLSSGVTIATATLQGPACLLVKAGLPADRADLF